MTTKQHQYRNWYENNSNWDIIASFKWEFEDALIAAMETNKIPYQIQDDCSIEEEGFNLWVPINLKNKALTILPIWQNT